MKKIISTLLSLSLFVTLLSCNDNDSPELIQEEEVITSAETTDAEDANLQQPENLG